MKTTLTVGMSLTTSNVEPYRSMNLRITDRPSGILIASVHLGPEDYMQVIGGQTHVEAEVPDVDQWARVGKMMHHRTLQVPDEVYRRYAGSWAEQQDVAQVWAREQAEPGETVTIQRSNKGLRAIFRKWVTE